MLAGRSGADFVTFGRWILIAALSAGAVYGLWNSHERTVAERGLLPFQDTNGFVPVQTPPGTLPDKVITSVVMGGEIPVVIVNGMAKANPTVDEVASEFRVGK